MEKFEGYDDIKVGYGENLKLGGHICKIIKVKIDTITTKDNKVFQQLILDIDIAEPDEQAGFFQRKFAEDAKADAMTAKWKGTYRLSIPKNDSDEQTKVTFKRFTTSVEKSNHGFVWNWEENLLVGKIFGGVFGLEEFVGRDGNVITFRKCRYARSIEKIDEVEIPKVKLVDKSLMDYEEYIAKRKAEREKENSNTENNTSVFEGSDSDLPF